jgi:hypothetical protein
MINVSMCSKLWVYFTVSIYWSKKFHCSFSLRNKCLCKIVVLKKNECYDWSFYWIFKRWNAGMMVLIFFVKIEMPSNEIDALTLNYRTFTVFSRKSIIFLRRALYIMKENIQTLGTIFNLLQTIRMPAFIG